MNVNVNDFNKVLDETKIIVVCRKLPTDQIIDIVDAMYRGGIRIVEVPFDQKDVLSNSETAKQVKMLIDKFGDKMFIGTGTTCTVEQVNLAKDAGAQIIIAPNYDDEIVKLTKEYGLISIPGCQTPSEMMFAHKYGADYIKLFPSNCLSLNAIKEILMPLNHLKVLKFGGVTKDNIKDVINTGCCGVGLSTAVLNKEAIKNKDYATIEKLAKEMIEAVNG